jgi:DNA-binding NarL/FixJ family response regulator
MSSVLADSYLQLKRRPAGEPRPLLALVHDGLHDPAALVSILASAGLSPNAGVLPLRRIGELNTNALEVIVVATDLAQPEGLKSVRSVHRKAPGALIVVVARDPTGALARQALNAGAEAFVSEHEALGPAVRAVAAGLVCAPRMTRRLVAKPTFSHREKEVLELLVAGLTNRQIADRLFLAESTVKTHVTSAYGKLGVRSRKDAAAILLDPAEGLAATALPADGRRGPAPTTPERTTPNA